MYVVLINSVYRYSSYFRMFNFDVFTPNGQFAQGKLCYTWLRITCSNGYALNSWLKVNILLFLTHVYLYMYVYLEEKMLGIKKKTSSSPPKGVFFAFRDKGIICDTCICTVHVLIYIYFYSIFIFIFMNIKLVFVSMSIQTHLTNHNVQYNKIEIFYQNSPFFSIICTCTCIVHIVQSCILQKKNHYFPPEYRFLTS